MESLVYAAKNASAGVALFGHTHKALYKTVLGVTLYNPGAIGSFGVSSWGQLTVTDSVLRFNTITV